MHVTHRIHVRCQFLRVPHPCTNPRGRETRQHHRQASLCFLCSSPLMDLKMSAYSGDLHSLLYHFVFFSTIDRTPTGYYNFTVAFLVEISRKDLVKHILYDSLTDKMEVDDQRYRFLDAHVASVEDSLTCRPPAFVEEAPPPARFLISFFTIINKTTTS